MFVFFFHICKFSFLQKKKGGVWPFNSTYNSSALEYLISLISVVKNIKSILEGFSKRYKYMKEERDM